MNSLLPLDDPRWANYRSGYKRAETSLVPWISSLIEEGPAVAGWQMLWDDLHHQGDVGEASYAVVPYLAAWMRNSGKLDWEPLHFAALVEVCRGAHGNPELPAELSESYFEALRELPELAIRARHDAQLGDAEIAAIAACLAASAGRRSLAAAYLAMGSDTAQEFLQWEQSR